MVAVCKDTTVKNEEEGNCVFFNIWSINVNIDSMEITQDGVAARKSGLEELTGDHSPGNNFYSFYKENGGKLSAEVGLRIISII